MQTTEVMNEETAISRFVIFNMDIAEIREAMNANLGDSGLTAGDFERIKVPAGGGTAWTIQGLNGEEVVKELVGIIVAWRDTRAYWSVPMEDSGGNTPPDCHSFDARTGIGDPGGDCHRCPLAKFGSVAKGEGQACKLIRQIFLLREGNVLPDTVNLPPSSVKPSHQHLLRLASKGVPCYGAITRISLEKTKNPQGIVYARAVLTAGGRLTPEQTQRAKEYGGMIESLLNAAPPIQLPKDATDTTED